MGADPSVARVKFSILSLCDYTGNMVAPWVADGHKAVLVDEKHRGVSTKDGVTRVGVDVRDYAHWLRAHPHIKFGMVFAFPPCTDLATSGARWFASKGPEALEHALHIVSVCVGIAQEQGCPWMVENPVSRLATHWRKPDYYFDPDYYAGWNEDDPWADAYRKKTCLWVGGGFKLPGNKKKGHPDRMKYMRPVPSTQGSKMHLMTPSDDRGDLRSVTPTTFAYATWLANKQL